MAKIAMVATAAITAASMITMNHAARFAASGEGWVIPMVLMKAFAMSRMNFMVSSMTDFEEIVAGIDDVRFPARGVNRKGAGRILWDKHLPEWWRAHTLKSV
jgi:hypothetical protein